MTEFHEISLSQSMFPTLNFLLFPSTSNSLEEKTTSTQLTTTTTSCLQVKAETPLFKRAIQ